MDEPPPGIVRCTADDEASDGSDGDAPFYMTAPLGSVHVTSDGGDTTPRSDVPHDLPPGIVPGATCDTLRHAPRTTTAVICGVLVAITATTTVVYPAAVQPLTWHYGFVVAALLAAVACTRRVFAVELTFDRQQHALVRRKAFAVPLWRPQEAIVPFAELGDVYAEDRGASWICVAHHGGPVRVTHPDGRVDITTREVAQWTAYVDGLRWSHAECSP
jgi:hypothetical protein